MPVNTLAPPPSGTFTQTCCILCFLSLRLRCCCRYLWLTVTHWRLRRCRHSLVVDVQSDAFYLLLPQLTPPLSSLRSRAHLPLPTPPSCSPFPKDRHRDAAATVVVPKSPIPRTHCIFLVLDQRLRCCRQLRGPGSEKILTFGLLTSFFFL